jgi:hypothetical protein
VISAEGVTRSQSKTGGIRHRKNTINSNMYERLFSIYLTPKAFEELRSKDFVGKVLSAEKRFKISNQFVKGSQDTSIDLAEKRASSVLPDVVSRNHREGGENIITNRKSIQAISHSSIKILNN